MVQASLRVGIKQRIALNKGLLFDLSLDSRIEKVALLSTEHQPDHIWEPQTTSLLVALSEGAGHVLVGGAYVGDQVLPIAHRASTSGETCVVHAFETMADTYQKLRRNIAINGLLNFRAHQKALWDSDDQNLVLDGEPALLGIVPLETESASAAFIVSSIKIDFCIQCE